MLDIPPLLQAINRRHATQFIAQERYPHGEQGAIRVINPVGKPFVLKWSHDLATFQLYQRARTVTALLQPLGYPVPTYVAIGTAAGVAYAIQEALPGIPLTSLTTPLITDLLRINTYHAQRLGESSSSWPAPIVEPTLFGGDGFCLLGPMRQYATHTSDLLSQLQGVMQTASQYRYPMRDIVHFDWNPSNILVDGSVISGVVDWDGWCWGDRMFDLVTLFFYCRGQEEWCMPLWTAVCQQVGAAIGTIYLAHLIHRQVDWSIRHHDQATIQHWIAVAHTLLQRFVVQ
jgi:aminoglycoside phosphotransferase